MNEDDKAVDHPKHYTKHPSGVECIDITEHFDFCLGNAIKYIWRAGEKNADTEIEDLKKARWYISRKIEKLEEKQSGKEEFEQPEWVKDLADFFRQFSRNDSD